MDSQIQVNDIRIVDNNKTNEIAIYFKFSFMGKTKEVRFCTICECEEGIRRLIIDEARNKAKEIRKELKTKNIERNLNNYFKDRYFILIDDERK